MDLENVEYQRLFNSTNARLKRLTHNWFGNWEYLLARGIRLERPMMISLAPTDDRSDTVRVVSSDLTV